MRRHWSQDLVFSRLVLEVEQETCAFCGRALNICDHRPHRIFTLQGPLELVCKLAHCPDRGLAAHHTTFSPHAELLITLPGWFLGWDVCFAGLDIGVLPTIGLCRSSARSWPRTTRLRTSAVTLSKFTCGVIRTWWRPGNKMVLCWPKITRTWTSWTLAKNVSWKRASGHKIGRYKNKFACFLARRPYGCYCRAFDGGGHLC